MASEKYDCGCEIGFGKQGEVRSVAVCERHESVFSQDKSLRQLALDLHHQRFIDKHAPKPAAEPKVTAPAELPKEELPLEGGGE